MENVTFPDFDDTTYNSTEDTKNKDPTIYLMVRMFNIISFSMTFILGVTGNGLVIWIAGFKMEKTVTILWFLNLAVADFMFHMFFPFQITEWIMHRYWPFGQTMCKVVFTVLFLNMSVSTSFLVIISVDRCTSVLCPVWSKNHRTPRLALTISAITWIICFILSTPDLVFLNVYHKSKNTMSYCTYIYADDYDIGEMRRKTVSIITLVSTFLIPFPIIVICYSLIVYRLRRSRRLSRSSRPLKVILVIVLCFFSFWLPFHMLHLLEVLNCEMTLTFYFVMFNLVYCIRCFNSCVNPIIYVFVGRDFKKSLFRSIPFLLEKTFKDCDGN